MTATLWRHMVIKYDNDHGLITGIYFSVLWLGPDKLFKWPCKKWAEKTLGNMLLGHVTATVFLLWHALFCKKSCYDTEMLELKCRWFEFLFDEAATKQPEFPRSHHFHCSSKVFMSQSATCVPVSVLSSKTEHAYYVYTRRGPPSRCVTATWPCSAQIWFLTWSASAHNCQELGIRELHADRNS